VELHPYGIHVSIVEPGIHATNFISSLKNYMTSTWDSLPSATKDEFGVEYLHKGCLKPCNYDAVIIARLE